MAEKEIKFGIIGCGMISNWHADAISQIGHARLTGVTDVHEHSRKAFAEKYNVKAFDTVEDLLSSPLIDVVCICTPSGLHAPLTIRAAKAGKHIIVEKPMALNLQEADEIIEACEVNRVKLAVISQLRFSDAVVHLKKAVDSGALGKLISGDIYMKYYRSQEYYDKGGWRGTWKMDGGGALMNQGIHGVDLLQYVMGPVKTVFGRTKTLVRKIEVEDTAAALLEFENGATGVIQATTSVYPGKPRRLEICGEKGTVILEEDCVLSWEVEGCEPPEGLIIGRGGSNTSNNPTNMGVDGHIRQISDMTDAIRYDRRPLVDQYEGRKPVEIITSIYESSKTSRLISFGEYAR